MFAIIKFSDDMYDVCQTTNITKVHKGACIVKYRTGSYSAYFLGKNDNMAMLLDIKQKLNNNLPILQFSNISTLEYIKNVNSYNFSVENTQSENMICDNVEYIQKKDVVNVSDDNLVSNELKICCTSTYENEYSEKINMIQNTDVSVNFDNVRNEDTNISKKYNISILKIINKDVNLDFTVSNDTNCILPTGLEQIEQYHDTTNQSMSRIEPLVDISTGNLENKNRNERVEIRSKIDKSDDMTCDYESPDSSSRIAIEERKTADINHNLISSSNCSNTCDDTTEYEPHESSYTEYTETNINDTSALTSNYNNSFCISSPNNTTVNTTSDASMKLNVEGFSACDDANLFVETSRGAKGQGKMNFCFFCHKMQTKIVRHLENVHKEEEEVKKFRFLPKKSVERRKHITYLRKKGNFVYNIDPQFNTGNLIPCRRPQKKMKRDASYFIPCPKCKGFFAKSSLRHHFQNCREKQGQTVKSTLALARKVAGRIHEDACQQLRDYILPVMREDNIVRLIRYDYLIIHYANKMCKKYTVQHQHDMIRAHLRLLGRFLMALKEINSEITDFASLYDPKFYDTAVKAINIVADLNETTHVYRAPSVASTLGTCVKKIGKILEAECIKKHDKKRKECVSDFLALLQEDYGCSVNKVVLESRIAKRRNKKVILPSKNDIITLNEYVANLRKSSYQELQKKFTYQSWLNLAKTTLIYIQIFNRKRAGETERLLISDLDKYEKIDENDDQYRTLRPEDEKTAEKYRRIIIRGKLTRFVPILLDDDMCRCLKMILKFRKDACVSSQNPYVFGIPGYYKKRYKYLRACQLMREFAHNCGAKHAKALRGTNLRKHIATTCASLNLPENRVESFAQFMGHHDKIHREIYRQPIAAIDILDMSKVLEKGLGIENENEKEKNVNVYNYEDISKNRRHNRIDNENDLNQKFTEDSPEQINCSKDEYYDYGNDNNYEPDDFSDSDNYESYKSTKKGKRITTKNKKNLLDETNQKRKHLVSNSIKKKRSTSPYGETKKRRWNEEEKELALSTFREYIDEKRLPSLCTIEMFKSQNACLKNRSAAVIKTWIHNQFKKTSKASIEADTKKMYRKKIKSIFADHIKKKTIPSMNECINAYNNFNILQKLSPFDVQDMILKEIHDP